MGNIYFNEFSPRRISQTIDWIILKQELLLLKKVYLKNNIITFESFKQKYMAVQTLSNYKNWKPVLHSVIKDKSLAEEIHEKGFAVRPFLNNSQLDEIRGFYEKEHQLQIKDGGMFYSLYSKDLEYRKRVHETINGILKNTLDEHFSGYKNIVNTFITKASGPQSEFYVHQDTTALDEFKYSPLSVWIPLQDITPDNGALGVIEKTHWFFSPYRGITIPSPFQKINNTLKEYLNPIYLKAGEAIIFDSRIVHNSLQNISGSDRLVALCGIFPKEAEFITCFKEPLPESKIEIIKQDDAYILENESFYYDCHTRPAKGELINKVENDFPEMDSVTFEKLCEINSIPKINALENIANTHCQFIAEPTGINFTQETATHKEKEPATVFQKLKNVFK